MATTRKKKLQRKPKLAKSVGDPRIQALFERMADSPSDNHTIIIERWNDHFEAIFRIEDDDKPSDGLLMEASVLARARISFHNLTITVVDGHAQILPVVKITSITNGQLEAPVFVSPDPLAVQAVMMR